MSRDSRFLKAFMLAALAWLPLAFIGWAVFSTALNYLPGLASGWLLQTLWPTIFSEVMHSGGPDWQVATSIIVRASPSGGMGQLVFELFPMRYGYSLPLFFGLVMATELGGNQRLIQCAIALPVLWLAQVFGIVTGALKMVQFDSGLAGQAAMDVAGMSADLVALVYQFGYLIMPAVVPVVLWMLLNRHFIDALGRGGKEPAAS